MRMSELERAMVDEFGDAYGRSVMRDVVLTGLGDRTAREALGDGVDARTVWLAICEEMRVPEQRRHGVGRLEPGVRRDR